ncbi:MAG: ribosome biogenesis GTP-binding protein YihA/YsxC [bacterium]|nr:ribosome biogenesis GTP-binding protein YihA/YsxC [bacterium]
MPAFKIPEAEFVLSCPDITHAPKRPLPEIAFAGRSNVGKSSLINSLLNRQRLALTSRTPGKTRLLNYFLIGRGLCYFVDLPGYGFARVPGATKAEWAETVEGYLRDSTRLESVVLLLDIRHGLTALDEQMVDALSTYHRRWLAVLTKADKLSVAARDQRAREMFGLLASRGAQAVLIYSSLHHHGREALWQKIMDALE